MQNKVACLYNKKFFEEIYKYMVNGELESCLDASNTQWFLLDVEEILIKEYGYRKASGGALL